MDVSLFKDPMILGLVLVTPVVIILLAKSWKRFKDKRAEKKQLLLPHRQRVRLSVR